MLETFQLLTQWNNPVAYAIPFFIILQLLEYFVENQAHPERFNIKDSSVNWLMGIITAVFDLFFKTLYLYFWLYLFEHKLFRIENPYLRFAILFFLEDLCFYFHHKFSHEIRILWASHVVHHSSQLYNLTTSVRQGWSEVMYKYVFWSILPLLGFEPFEILIQMSISLIYQFWIHTETIVKLPFFIEYIFNTPSHHRVHHGSNEKYLDKNYGAILIIWDRIFGTYELESEKVKYGITTNLNTYNLLKVATNEYYEIIKDMKNAKGINKIKILIMPPGWKP